MASLFERLRSLENVPVETRTLALVFRDSLALRTGRVEACITSVEEEG
jgi:hypothetical protein